MSLPGIPQEVVSHLEPSGPVPIKTAQDPYLNKQQINAFDV